MNVRYALACREAITKPHFSEKPAIVRAWLVASRQARAYRTLLLSSQPPTDPQTQDQVAVSTNHADIPTRHDHIRSKQTPTLIRHCARARCHYTDRQPSNYST